MLFLEIYAKEMPVIQNILAVSQTSEAWVGSFEKQGKKKKKRESVGKFIDSIAMIHYTA